MSTRASRVVHWVIAVVVLAATGAVTTQATASGSAPPQAHVWITTPDGALKLADQGSVPFHPGGSSNVTVTVDPSRRYQRMDGFGASITDSSAAVLSQLDRRQRDATMTDLFSPSRGDGLSFLRQPMGSSDFTASARHYTYDDMPAGRTDYGMRHFSIAHDRRQIIPLLRQALKLNPQIKVIGTPWSAPAWMKTSQSLIGGRLIDDPRVYEAYADYFVRFVRAYQRAGVPIYGLTLQNEPQNRHPSGYPGMDFPVAQEAKLVEALGPKLRAAHLQTKLFGYDHNWSEHPDDIASTPPGQDPEPEYPFDLMRSGAGKYLAGTAFHCYAGDQSRQTAMHEAFPDKGVWFTECSGSHGASDPPAQVFSDTLKWHARNIVLGVTRNWGKSVVNWNLALDPSGGPHNGGCDTCSGVVTVEPGRPVTRNAEYYTLGHLARFVKPGATRIASSSFGTTGWNGQIMDAAFRNRDGSTALVVHNENDAPRAFAVQEGGESFDYTLPGGALATFTWPASAALADGLKLLPADGTTASADPNGADADKAVDDDAATRWSTGSAQAAGQWLKVDLGRERSVRRVVVDTGADTGDFPRGYELATSEDGQHWTTAASGAGSGQLTAIDIGATRARYVRVTQTATAPQWWSVADLRIYG
ncbi:MAG: glucosylceramidase [Solirubrobacteraceae bacterium]|jgi:glucosylceramidase|nr:glucosylceramidase [Solirubrobacteraceae bacterium]